jgi:amino acid adenylation domain-containing protein
MVPSAFVVLDRFPLTPNGKLDRGALPAPSADAYIRRPYDPPRESHETILAAIWQELLSVDQVGRDDNFFALGGHSLLVVQMMQRLRAMGLSAEVHRVFESASLAELAAALVRTDKQCVQAPPNLIPAGCEAIAPEMLPLVHLRAEHIEQIAQQIPGGHINIQDIYPLAPLQEGIFFHNFLAQQDGDAYVRPVLMEVPSRERLQELSQALQSLIDRHDVLRTAILWENLPQPVQVVCRHVELPMEEFALDRDRNVIEQLRQEMRPEQQKLDLRSAPLMRLQIAQDPRGDRWYALLQTHHLVFDDESFELLLSELLAHLNGNSDSLPPPVSYREHVAQAVASARSADAAAFFRNELGDVSEPTAPFGLLDVYGDGGRIDEARETLDATLARRLRTQAARLGASPADIFHSAWALVMAHTSGRDDVVCGSVLLGRMHGNFGASRALGMFINTLPLRVRVGECSAAELVMQTRRQLVALLRYEQTSLPMAQRCSGIAPPAPLFSSLLNYLHSSPDSDEAQQWEKSGIRVVESREWTNYPVVLSVDDQGQGFVLTTQIDRRVGASRMLGYVRTSLQSLVEALERTPGTPAISLSILPEDERCRVVETFNATQASYSTDERIHELIEAQALRTPGAVAVVCGNQQVTYKELNERANRLARLLMTYDVGPERLVAVGMERTIDMVVGLLAILKAGGAYLPLDMSYPADRLVSMLRDSAPVLLLTQEEFRKTLALGGLPVLTFSETEGVVDRGISDELDLGLALDSDSLAYVIYTSGSTGTPKGVMVTHRNLANLVHWHCSAFNIDERSVCSCLAALGFDAAVWEIWPALSRGATLLLAPPKLGGDVEALLAWWRTQPLHVSFLPTPIAELAFGHDIENRELRTLLVGGDRLTQRPSECSFRLVNNYGPTECTVVATSGTLEPEDPALHIGRPISNAQIYLLDSRRQPVPLGVAGELYVGGAGVARGYLNRPDLTRERFVPDPFSSDAQARLYRTGDLARWRTDGTIEFLGRNDDQVKIRGFRIELGEIEARLAAHPSIEEVAVLAREDSPGQKRLVAYVVPRTGASAGEIPSANEFRLYLRTSCPEYMVPSAFVTLARLPLTQNGKVDRRALPIPEASSYASRSYEPPENKVEEVLASIWRQLLEQDKVGRNDNFFELGGHSLLIVQMMEQLRRAGLSARVQSVFESPTLADLARTLTLSVDASEAIALASRIPAGCDRLTPDMLPLADLEQLHIETITRAVLGGARNILDIYPLTPLQEGMLFHHLLDESGGDTYVVATLLAVASRERVAQLIEALQALIDRHDVLRTAVLWEGLPQPLQVVCRQARLPVREVVLDRGRDARAQVQEWLNVEQQKIDLHHAPLMQLRIAADPQGSGWFALLQMHHMIDDGVSLRVMISEAVAHMENRAGEVLPDPIAYRSYVAQALAHSRNHDAAAFFRRKLADVTESTAPFGVIDVRGDSGRIDEARLTLDQTLSQRVRAQASRQCVSVATLFHAAWGLVVARTSGRDDVVFGSVLLGRLKGAAGSRHGVGMFINTLPLRLRLANTTARALVESTHRELIELLNHEEASLSVAQRCSGIAGTAPLFTAILNYRHSAPEPDADWSGASGVEVLALQYRTNYPLSLSVDDAGEGFTFTVHADRCIDPHQIAAYMQVAMSSLVAALENNSLLPVLSLPVLPESERRQVVDVFNTTDAPFPHERLLHEIFEEQVRRTPDALAVIFERELLTFAELNAKANQLARHLRKRGVGPDQPIGICVERSLEMIIGLLGILKAGGAYVPLDPDYPTRTLTHVLSDAAPRVVLIQAHLRGRLPSCQAQVLALDADWRDIGRESGDDLQSAEVGLQSHHLAYVIYTSGSTGLPKGVMIEHRNVVSLWQGLEQIYRHSARSRRVGVNASFNFDASVKQIVQLLSGRTLVLIPQAIRADAAVLSSYLDEHEVDAIDCTPSQLKSWLANWQERRPRHPLKVVLVGGEPIDPDLWCTLAQFPETDFYNVYGPTESTVDATFARVRDDLGTPHIGAPMENRRLYILDAGMEPVGIGIVGEIYIGGAGVARGYLNRPELTAERFVKDPFAGSGAGRLYRTGDLGRWRADGVIEYLGRNDHQVKIRGHRIELGEIEAQLLQQPQVREAVVLAREDVPGEKRLVAYVVRERTVKEEETGESTQKLREEVASEWEAVHEGTYQTNATVGPSFVGWNSSYTGEPIPEPEMSEWLSSTVERIWALRPRKLLEIGCGVGLLLQHVAPRCERYVGVDFAAAALEQLRQWMKGREELSHVELLHRTAQELGDVPSGSFDTVVVNSVVQYFPDMEYLVGVLREAVRVVSPGGRIFLGDIRHLGSLNEFHSRVQLGKAGATVSVGELRQRIERSLSQEKELVIDPQFFTALPGNVAGVGAVEVQLKRGHALNELTCYRYDVIVHCAEQLGRVAQCEELAWSAVGSVQGLEEALAERRWDGVKLVEIPDARVARDVEARRVICSSDEGLEVSALRRQLNECELPGAVDPERIWELGQAQGYEVQLSPAGAGYFTARLIDRSALKRVPVKEVPVVVAKPWSAYGNDPLENTQGQQLVPRLREALKERLPEYMIPAAWMVLKQLPLTPNGKVDRRALPNPQGRSEEMGEYVAPRTPVQQALAGIWAQLLQLDQVGLHDNFFELGGHSLLATQVTVRIRSSLAIDMPMRFLFEFPTIEQLAAEIENLRNARLLEEMDRDNEMDDLLAKVAAMPESEAREWMRELRMGQKS